ncbi:hypothetical protein TPA0909_25770 [Streptomyces albus]|nr:hypothetical protein TPA0909_25770 [Streptomyces albus]
MMTGSPRIVVPSVPPDPSYSSTWSRTHCSGLGSYSPWIGMLPTSPRPVTVGPPEDAPPASVGLPRAGRPYTCVHLRGSDAATVRGCRAGRRDSAGADGPVRGRFPHRIA